VDVHGYSLLHFAKYPNIILCHPYKMIFLGVRFHGQYEMQYVLISTVKIKAMIFLSRKRNDKHFPVSLTFYVYDHQSLWPSKYAFLNVTFTGLWLLQLIVSIH